MVIVALALFVLFIAFAFLFSPWWLLAILGLLVEGGEYATLFVAAIVLAFTESPWWLLLWVGLLI